MTPQPDRRQNPVRLEPKYEDMLTQIHTLLTDENMGLCITVKEIKNTVHGDDKTPGLRARMDAVEPIALRCHAAVFENGWMGLRLQILLVWIAVLLLGTDNPLAQKIIARWWK